MIQPSTYRCDCGQIAPVVQVKPYGFTWRCPCGRAGYISWSSQNPPPQFVPAVAQPTQVCLFEEVVR